LKTGHSFKTCFSLEAIQEHKIIWQASFIMWTLSSHSFVCVTDYLLETQCQLKDIYCRRCVASILLLSGLQKWWSSSFLMWYSHRPFTEQNCYSTIYYSSLLQQQALLVLLESTVINDSFIKPISLLLHP
jgi:hypothetical protein